MIEVQRHSYRGRNPKLLEDVRAFDNDASILEKHINQMISNGKTGIFLYSNIAREVGLRENRVKEILFSVSYGSNGFTI